MACIRSRESFSFLCIVLDTALPRFALVQALACYTASLRELFLRHVDDFEQPIRAIQRALQILAEAYKNGFGKLEQLVACKVADCSLWDARFALDDPITNWAPPS